MNLKKIEFKEIRNYIVYGSGQFVNLLSPLLIAPYVISVCGIEQWGKVGAATSIYIILGIFIEFGSQLLGVKEISSNKSDHDYIRNYLSITYAFRLIVLLSICTGCILFLITFSNLDSKLYLLGLWALISQFFNPIWFYIGIENFKRINKIIVLSKAFYVILIYLFVNQKSDYIYVVFLLGLSNTLVYSYYFFKIFKTYKLSLLSVSKNQLISNVKKEFPIVISNLSISVYTNFPILIIKFVLGDFYAGIYKVGDMFLNILRSYLSVFFNVSFPKFCNLYAVNKKEAILYLKKINIFNICLLSVMTIFLYFVSFYFINTFDIDKKLKDSFLFCTNFLFVSLIIALNIPFYQLLLLKNHQKNIARISFIGAILMLISCYFLSLNFNLNGSIISIYIVEIFITVSIIKASLSLSKND